MGFYACFIAVKNSSRVYERAAVIHFLFAGIMLSVVFIILYAQGNGIEVQPFTFFEDEVHWAWAILGMVVYMGVLYFLVGCAYCICGTKSSMEENDEQHQNTDKINRELDQLPDVDDDVSDCIMTTISLFLAGIHFTLFVMLVRDGGNRCSHMGFPNIIYYALVGMLGFYSSYTAVMHSVPVYQTATVVHTGLSMVAFSFCFISLFHSVVKLTGVFDTKRDSREGSEYLMYGILAALLGCIYCVVAYLYSEYNADTGISSAINPFLLMELNEAPRVVEYQGLDEAKLHKDEDIEEIHVGDTPKIQNNDETQNKNESDDKKPLKSTTSFDMMSFD
jgi:cytochrome bd-type quinol oxidase subunit 2